MHFSIVKKPYKAKLLLNSDQEFKIAKIHFDTNLITLKEHDKVYNTVSVKNVKFDFSDFTPEEIVVFLKKFN